MLLTILTAVVLAAQIPAAADAGAIRFDTHVLPILEQHCVECHRASHVDARGRMRQPKGDLRLDSRAGILAGGSDGAAIVAGQPGDSSLYQRIALPADDPDVMPKDADPLSQREIELIRRWIEEGADLGAWQVDGDAPTSGAPLGDPAPPLPGRFAPLVALGAPLRPLDAATLRSAAGDKAMITPVLPDGPLLRVAFPSHEGEIGDADLRALLRIKQHITELDLGRTGITDRALDAIADMPNLTRLDLSRTAVTSQGLARLAPLPELRALNLYETAVDDQGMAAIAAIARLEQVHLYGAEVTAEGVAGLRQRRPDLRVQCALVLPDAAAARDD